LTVFRQRLGSAPLPRRYQAVSMLDVLEHLEDPLSGLLAARNALNPGGYLLLSIPNIGHWRIVADLLAGRFDYAPVGIQCITHLRFFTIVKWRDQASPPPPDWQNLITSTHPQYPLDTHSLATEAFHVLARRD
jgi:SAM-dependent methyltransferase